MQNKERKLKILPKFFPRRWKDVIFPEIRLAGKWLQDLGFKCGRHVVISQQDNTITITILPEAEIKPVIKKPKRKAGPQLPPELINLPIYQLLNTHAEEYRKHIEAVKEWKRNKKEKAFKSSIERDFAKRKSNNSRIFQMHPEPAQVAAPNDQIIQLHPQVNQAADGCNFDTIA
ncbi:MAG: HSP20-like protein [Bacteroidetes bacterium]|jgi:toxic protein SymE|nr:HSP20-like protein [Bacteroidota bacterium]